MLQRTEGIVLKTSPFGEADLIVTYLTSDHGIIRTFAKSPRKIKSRFGSSLEPLTCARISFWGREDSALPRLTQSDIIHSFHSIRSTLNCFLRVSEVIELTLNFLPEREASKKVYALLMNTMKVMESECNTGLLLVFYKLRLLEAVGFLPRFSGCGRCGKKGDCFYVSHGTVLCGSCSKGHQPSIRLSPGVVNLYASLLGWSIAKLDRIKPPEAFVSELSAVIDEHVKYITERSLKTKSFRAS
ncbi:MAG: DNA repair protein RecO [Nitrospirae bacterium]|nr:DNA repair protein RecO [Nitrospirota bacterium]